MAAAARLVQLEDEIRTLRSGLPTTPPKKPRGARWFLAFGLVFSVTAAAIWWTSKPAAQTVMQTNGGIAFSVIFRTSVRDVRFESEDGKTTIPMLSPPWTFVDPNDRDETPPVRSASVILKDSQLAAAGPTRLRVRYHVWGFERTALLEFEAAADGNRFLRGTLEGIPQWVAFRDFDGQTLIYFTTLLAYKPTLREIRWGLDDEPLERRVAFERSEKLGIDTEHDQMFTSIPSGTTRARLQLVYADGSISDVRTILRSDSTIQ